MIRRVNIVGAQCNDTHAQHYQRPRDWAPGNVNIMVK